MPERWQQELSKLRNVEPDAGTWERAQRPPHGDGMPPRRQRVVAGVVAFAVFAAAGVFAWHVVRPSTSADHIPGAYANSIIATFAVVEGSHGGTGPSGTLTVGDRTIEGTVASYCWSTRTVEGCSDTIPPAFSPVDFTTVTTGSSLVVAGDAGSVTAEIDGAGQFPFQKVRDLGTITDPVALDEPPGRYVLYLVAHFDQGDVPYYFPIELVDASSPTTLLLACGDDGQAHVRTPIVQATRRGVWTDVVNTGSARVYRFVLADAPDATHFSGRVRADDVKGLWPLFPGRWLAGCLGPSSNHRDVTWVPFRVTDPQGFWVSTALDCPVVDQIKVVASTDHGDSYPQTVRREVQGVRPSDSVEAAGYVGIGQPTYRVVRGGRVITVVNFGESGDVTDGFACRSLVK